jgi:hypothetical protein
MFENVTILLKNMKIYFVYASLQIFTSSDWLRDVTYGIYTHICKCAVKHDIHRLGNICMGNRMPRKIIISLENITPDISRFRKVSTYCSVSKTRVCVFQPGHSSFIFHEIYKLNESHFLEKALVSRRQTGNLQGS